jgi:hypothetical protein
MVKNPVTVSPLAPVLLVARDERKIDRINHHRERYVT